MIWRDLSDSELRRRLEQRGVDPALAVWLVAHRDRDPWATEIDDLLDR